jgi:hypothetical protein
MIRKDPAAARFGSSQGPLAAPNRKKFGVKHDIGSYEMRIDAGIGDWKTPNGTEAETTCLRRCQRLQFLSIWVH